MWSLFQFYVIAGIEWQRTVSNEYCRSVRAFVNHDAFADDFTRQVSPAVLGVCTAKTVQLVLIVFGLRGSFCERAFITEDAEIISDAHTLIATKIDIDRAVLAVQLGVAQPRHNHGDTLAANWREMVEGGCILKRWTGAFHEGTHNIAALHVTTRHTNL